MSTLCVSDTVYFRVELRDRATETLLATHLLEKGRYCLSPERSQTESVEDMGHPGCGPEDSSWKHCAHGTFFIDLIDSSVHLPSAKKIKLSYQQPVPCERWTWRIVPFEFHRKFLWEFVLEHFFRQKNSSLTEAAYTRFLEDFFETHALPEEPTRSWLEAFHYQWLGLGPIEPYLHDPSVSEILVTGTEPIVIEQAGRLLRTEQAFPSRQELRFTCEKLALFSEKSFTPAQPVCEGVWRGGERIELVHECLAPEGPLLSVRRHLPVAHTLETWAEQGALSLEEDALLRTILKEKKTLLIAGTTGAGKTTLLQALTQLIPSNERWISIEDTLELQRKVPLHLRLRTRTENQDGRGSVSMAQLIHCSLRLRPDRFVIGEVRGPESLYLIQALSTGHAGSLATIHARSADEALLRLVLMAGMHPQAPRTELLQELVHAVIDAVVVVERDASGKRRVCELLVLNSAKDLPKNLHGRVSGGRSVLNASHLKRHSVITGTQDAVWENNHNELPRLGHGHRRVNDIALRSGHEERSLTKGSHAGH